MNTPHATYSRNAVYFSRTKVIASSQTPPTVSQGVGSPPQLPTHSRPVEVKRTGTHKPGFFDCNHCGRSTEISEARGKKHSRSWYCETCWEAMSSRKAA